MSLVASLILSLALLAPSPAAPAEHPNQIPPEIVGELTVHQITRYKTRMDIEAIVGYQRHRQIEDVLRLIGANQRAAAVARARQQRAYSRPAPQTSGDCYSGTPVPAYIINRESGGDPNAVNPSSGALGCYQLMPMHFASGGTCAGLSTDLAGQKACAQRLYNAAGLSPWAL